MNDYSYCAIAHLIQEPYNKIICNASKKLSDLYGSWFVLSENEFPPHLTTWLAYIPTKNIPLVIDELSKIESKLNSFSIGTVKIKIQESGFVSLGITSNRILNEIHTSLLKHFNVFREGYIPQKYLNDWQNLPIEQQSSIKQYGTRFAGSFFNPHITIGVVQKEFIEECAKALPYELEDVELIVDNLTFFRQKKEGKSIELLHTIKLL